jgi:hypothetical protein
MRLAAALLLGAALTSVALAEVVELTPDNFDALTSEGEWMVALVAPWCKHCQKLKPVYAAAARAMDDAKAGAVPTRFGRIDGSAYTSLMLRFGAGGYPTLYHLAGSEARRVNVPHSREALVEFATRGWKSAPPMGSFESPVALPRKAVFWGMRAAEKGASRTARRVVTPASCTVLALHSLRPPAARSRSRRNPRAHR